MFFDARRFRHGRWQILSVTGEIDLATLPRMRSELHRVSSSGPLAVDLSDCDLIDSTGLGLLVGAARRSREGGHDFCVIAPSGPVADLLRRSRLDEVMNVRVDMPEEEVG